MQTASALSGWTRMKLVGTHLFRNMRSPESWYAEIKPPTTRMVVSNTEASYALRNHYSKLSMQAGM